VIHWNRPYILANLFSPEMLPVHILEAAYTQNPTSITTHPWLTTEYVGTGPFKLKEFVPAVSMELTAFDGYALGRPKVDEIEVRFIPDGNTMLAQILSGAGDLATGTGPNVTQAGELKSQSWDGQISATVGATYLHLFAQYIDPATPVITDKRFHKALMYALDRQELVDTFQSGYGGIAHMPWSTTDPDYKDILAKIETYAFDQNRAAAMFQGLGYAKGSDGFLRNNATGQRLEQIEFRTTGEQVFQVRMLAAMSDYFKNVGLDINQVVVPQERTSDRVYRITNPGLEELQFGYGPSTLVNFMHSSLIPTPANGYAQGNYPRYSNPRWDGLLEKYAVAIQPAERKQVLTDIMVYLSDELMDMSIIYGVTVQFASKRLTVPEVNPIWTAESWDVR
jgi:peptide/nickel transport system substrate-binding protein